MKRYINGSISIPHAAMLKLRQEGKLNLGMVNDVAMKIADNPDLAPKAKSSGLAMHFWSWVAVGQFLYSIYWSFTGLWWIFIPSLFLWVLFTKQIKKVLVKIYFLKQREIKSFMKR